jgi:hypothetical protein
MQGHGGGVLVAGEVVEHVGGAHVEPATDTDRETHPGELERQRVAHPTTGDDGDAPRRHLRRGHDLLRGPAEAYIDQVVDAKSATSS